MQIISKNYEIIFWTPTKFEKQEEFFGNVNKPINNEINSRKLMDFKTQWIDFLLKLYEFSSNELIGKVYPECSVLFDSIHCVDDSPHVCNLLHFILVLRPIQI